MQKSYVWPCSGRLVLLKCMCSSYPDMSLICDAFLVGPVWARHLRVYIQPIRVKQVSASASADCWRKESLHHHVADVYPLVQTDEGWAQGPRCDLIMLNLRRPVCLFQLSLCILQMFLGAHKLLLIMLSTLPSFVCKIILLLLSSVPSCGWPQSLSRIVFSQLRACLLR